jgi:ABC-type Na+ efflux pump permease subunit
MDLFVYLLGWEIILQKLLLVGALFFGVTFIFGSLGAFLEGSLIAGLLMLIGGILLLPPVKRLIIDKNPSLSRGKITAVGSILIFISMFFVSSDDAKKLMAMKIKQ